MQQNLWYSNYTNAFVLTYCALIAEEINKSLYYFDCFENFIESKFKFYKITEKLNYLNTIDLYANILH